MQVQIGIEVFLWDAITNMKVATIMVCGLQGSHIGEKAIHDGYVVMKVIDVFIPFAAIPFAKIIGDPTIRELRDSKGCVHIWSKLFLKFSWTHFHQLDLSL
jgi:hypothetical protein